MSDDLKNYEQVSIYRLDAAAQEQLLSTVRECVFNWCTRDEWPMGVIMSCVWAKDRLWLTAGAHRHRISAIRRNPKVSVVATSTGTELGPGKTVTIKGKAVVHEDPELKTWFYKIFSDHLNPTDPAASEAFQQMLDSPLRIVIEIIPEKYVSYDGAKMAAHTAGTLDESELAEPLESDTARLEAEMKRRGMS